MNGSVEGLRRPERIAREQASRSLHLQRLLDALMVNRTYAANGLNQYTSAGPASFTYDANGNLVSDGTVSFVYDAENRLISASNGTSLTYDPTGRLWQVAQGAASSRLLAQVHLR